MLKSYIVKTKNIMVGNQNKIINYMINSEHINHKDTNIICGDNVNEFKEYLLGRLHHNQMNYALNKKGGKPLKRIAKSLTFNIPKSFESSNEQLLEIDRNIKSRIIELCQGYDIDLNVENLFSAIHQQDNNHIHMILPMIDNKGINARQFNTPSFQTELKVIFTQVVDKVLDKDFNQYKLPTKEIVEHNEVEIELKKLLNDYEYILTSEDFTEQERAATFLKTQITNIKRLLKKDEEINHIDLDKINKNIHKVNTSEHIQKELKQIDKDIVKPPKF